MYFSPAEICLTLLEHPFSGGEGGGGEGGGEGYGGGDGGGEGGGG